MSPLAPDPPASADRPTPGAELSRSTAARRDAHARSRRLPPTHQHSTIASKSPDISATLPFRTTAILGATYGKRPLPPLTPSPRNRFPVHYSMDRPTGVAADDAAWRSTASPRVLNSIKQVEQYGDAHSARVAKLQVLPPREPPSACTSRTQ